MKILVCDDAVGNREILGNYLEQMGHHVVFAQNDNQVLEGFTEHKPELVFIDTESPSIEAYQVARAIQQYGIDFSEWTPVIFVSSIIDEDIIQKGIAAGADDWLLKPISPTILSAKMHGLHRLQAMRDNLMDFGNQLREINEKYISATQLISELALKDPLTRLGNRRAFEENLMHICQLAMRECKPVSLAVIDIDYFKIFNDTYGYAAGDACLQQVAQLLKRGIHRVADFGARYEGDGFALIMPDTPLSGAMHVMERLRMGVEALRIPNKNAPAGIVTLSIGVASSKAETEFVTESLVAAVDAALYNAKESSRNRVVGAKMAVNCNLPDPLSYKSQNTTASGSTSSKH